jgi:hypothetical protein
MTAEEFNALRTDRPEPPAPKGAEGERGTAKAAAASPADTRADVQAAVQKIILPHLARVSEVLVRAVQNGNIEAAMALVELWRWARER